MLNQRFVKVGEFIDAEDALREFKEEHAPLFDQLRELTERYNAALEQAEQVCRAREVSCGPIDLYQYTTKYDATALYNAVGRDQFLALGGQLSTVTEYSVDKGRLEAAIAQNKIAADVVPQIRKETPNFHKPNKLVLP